MNNAVVNFNEENYIFFSIGKYTYAFNIKYVLDIMQLVELEYPESMPEFITGLLEYNNQIIKIIDIRNILKLDTSDYNLNSKIIIVKGENDIFGVVIDEVVVIRHINKAHFNKPPYDSIHSFIEAIYTGDSIQGTIIDIKSVEKKINSKDNLPADPKESAAIFLPKNEQSKEILHRRREHYARKMRQESYEIIKSQDTYITFQLADNTCCVKILHVTGFYKFGNIKLIKVPCTRDFILGIVSAKGRYITVIDLLKFTQNKSVEITKDSSIIVVEYEDYEIGIIADAIGETIDIDEGLITVKSDKPTGCLNECVINSIMYMFLDVKALFGDEKLYIS